MTREQLSAAMSYIPDELVMNAYAKPRFKNYYLRIGVIAASLLLVIGISLPYVWLMQGAGAPDGSSGSTGGDYGEGEGEGSGEVGDGSATPDRIYNVGATAYGNGEIEYLSYEEDRITLRYAKNNDGYTHLYLDAWTYDNGEYRNIVVTSNAFYDFDKNGYDSILLDVIKIYVDGELSTTGYLPYKAGEYEIVLDLSGLASIDSYEYDDKLLITGFGYFSIK